MGVHIRNVCTCKKKGGDYCRTGEGKILSFFGLLLLEEAGSLVQGGCQRREHFDSSSMMKNRTGVWYLDLAGQRRVHREGYIQGWVMGQGFCLLY